MEPIGEIEVRRRAILNEMSAIRLVVRGTFKEQMLSGRVRDQKEPVLRGPYYLLAIWKDGKTHSRRIRSADVPRTREGAANYKRLRELCEEFAVLTERLGELERTRDSQEALKKGLKSRRNATRK